MMLILLKGIKNMVFGIKKLPVGIVGFKEIRDEDFYYIDKTKFIKEQTIIAKYIDKSIRIY
jgi:hypothetical protein